MKSKSQNGIPTLSLISGGFELCFVEVFLLSLLLLSTRIIFQGQKLVSFLEVVFGPKNGHLKIKKTSTFFRNFFGQKKCRVILSLNSGSGNNVMHGFHAVFLMVNLLRTKSFPPHLNFLICSVHNSVIQNTTFFNIFHVSLPCDRKYLESKDDVREPIFFGKPTSNRFKSHT